MQLDGKVAIVTGSSRGLGRAIALELGRRGASVVVNYLRSQQLAAEAAQELNRLGAEAICVQADVSDPDQATALARAAQDRWGRVDILVNNAGILRDRTLRKMTPLEWSEVLSVNLNGLFNCCRAVVDSMIERREGRIISIASVIGESGGVGQTNYGASKAGVIGFTRSLALELAGKGITVNAVAPGYMQTDMLRSIPDSVLESIAARIPMGTFGTPEDVANAVAFLASPESRYVTGHVLNVNGGLYM